MIILQSDGKFSPIANFKWLNMTLYVTNVGVHVVEEEFEDVEGDSDDEDPSPGLVTGLEFTLSLVVARTSAGFSAKLVNSALSNITPSSGTS